MTVTLDHVTRTVDGVPTIRDVSLTLESGTLSVLLSFRSAIQIGVV
jgi:glycerol transport system ATP-binding protein